MEDRKQEVIEILARERCSILDHREDDSPCPRSLEWAEGFYNNRIAPHFEREFPEIQEFCNLFLKTCNRGFYPKEIRPFYDALCLWQAPIADAGKLVGLRPDAQDEKNRQASQVLANPEQDKPKGTCQKCGGSKEVTISVPEPFRKAKVECPQCGGTGECQHKNVMKVKGTPDTTYCHDCKGYIKDRRSGEERRRQCPITLEFMGSRIYYLDPCVAAYIDHRTRTRRK